MRITLLPTVLFLIFFHQSLISQNCIDIPNLPTSQINSNINDDTNYPVGSAFWSDGNIEFIKTPNTNQWNHQPGDSAFCISGNPIDFTISVANAISPKTLDLGILYEDGVIVDGDTVYNNANPPATYSGANFTFTENIASSYTISGDFDTVQVFVNGGNLCVYEICLEENTSTSNDCVDIPNLPVNQINDNINDNVNYPMGSVFWSEGNIEFIKKDTLNWNHQPGDSTFCISGNPIVFTISVANAVSPKTLDLGILYEDGVIVDGDTIYNNSNPPATYSGSGFTFTENIASSYTISGDFDTVQIFVNGGNLCVYEICLEENTLDLNKTVQSASSELAIFPNPVQPYQTININNDQIIREVLVKSLNGQLLLQQHSSAQQVSFPIDGRFKSGIYIVSLLIDDHWQHRKLIIQ